MSSKIAITIIANETGYISLKTLYSFCNRKMPTKIYYGCSFMSDKIMNKKQVAASQIQKQVAPK